MDEENVIIFLEIYTKQIQSDAMMHDSMRNMQPWILSWRYTYQEPWHNIGKCIGMYTRILLGCGKGKILKDSLIFIDVTIPLIIVISSVITYS